MTSGLSRKDVDQICKEGTYQNHPEIELVFMKSTLVQLMAKRLGKVTKRKENLFLQL